jgi:hypothetical protein
MPIARDDYREYFTEKLWQWLPAVYRELDDTDGAHALRAFVAALGAQAAFLKRNQDRLWDDAHVELASDWAIPYIADLVATRLVSALDPRARRVDVAKTIYYRRRKGTLAVLEQLIADITGWDGKVVEEFRRLARAPHGLDGTPVRGRLTRTPAGGFADLRAVRGSRLAGDAFDEFHYTPDVRKPTGLKGRRGITKLSFHLFRLHPVRFGGVEPRRVRDFAGSRDGFTFDPSGRDIPLFSTDQSHASGSPLPDAQGDWGGWRSAEEWQLPRAIPCRLLGESIFSTSDAQIAWILNAVALIPAFADRQAAAADLRRIAGERFFGRAAFTRVLRALPAAAFTTTPGVLAQLLPRSLVPDCGSAALLPDGGDPISWPASSAAIASSIGEPAVVARFDNATGPVPRSATRAARLDAWAPPVVAGVRLFIEPSRGRFVLDHAPDGIAPLRVDYHVGMLAPIGAGAYAREVDGAPATITWANGSSAAGTPANAIAQIADSRNYIDPPDAVNVIDCTVRAAEEQRPYVVLATADWAFPAAPAGNAFLRFDGLWIGARVAARHVRIGGNFERVRLRCVTLDPGGDDALGVALPVVTLVVTGFVEKLVIDRCILAGITLQGAGARIERIVMRDSIVDAQRTGAVAINATSAELHLVRSTVIAPTLDDIAMRVERLDATDSLIAGIAKVADTQHGCFRFSARAAGSTVPHPYRSHVLEAGAPLFATKRFGDPAYAQLSPIAPEALQRGAENGGEIGAYASALVPIRRDGLGHKIDEYLPFGRVPNFVVEN